MIPLCLAKQRKKGLGCLLGAGHLLREKYRSLLLLGIMLILGSRCLAQVETANVSGTITDQSGAAIIGAEVHVTNADTNVTSKTSSNQSGVYLVTGLKPGRYRIHVGKEGFKGIDLTDLVLNVQDSISRNFALQVGSMSETVTVNGGDIIINTTDAAVSTVIDRNFVESLPLNGRSFNTLLQLTPGVIIAPSNPSSPGQFSISGQRTSANTFSIDGVSANFGAGVGDTQGNGTGASQAFSVLGGTSSLVSVDALQEFRIETSSFAPEFGHTPGGQIILTTRPGTNTFHGSAYEYFRNDVMDANDWFANSTGIPRAPERHNDFGGFLGGPILKDKTFFFFSYEGARLRLPQTTLISVPSACARANGPTCPSGNQSASATIAPYFNAFPQPNGPAPTDPCASQTPDGCFQQFAGSWSNTGSLDATSIRIDHQISGRFSIFGRYNHAPSKTINRSNAISYFSPRSVNTNTLTLGSEMLLSNTISNVVRLNYSTQSFSLTNGLDSFGGAVPLSPSLLLGSLSSTDNVGGFIIPGHSGAFYSIGPSVRTKTAQANLVDDLTKNIGSHQLKFGVDFRTIYFHRAPAGHGVIIFVPSVPSLIASGNAILVTGTHLPARLRTDNLSLYGQDTWHVASRFTVTYGLRWELNPAPTALGSTNLAAWTNVDNPAQLALAPAGTSLWSTTYDNFAPRVGIAYQLTRSGNLVLRAGWGLFYDLGVTSAGALAELFPDNASGFHPNVSLPVADPSPFLPTISNNPSSSLSVNGYSPNLKSPRSYQWNVALEKSFGGHQVFSATYVGQGGRDLLRQIALFQPNANFSGEFLLTENDARSNYNALQLQFRRPLSRGLQALLNYTWSHSLDNASNDVIAGFSNTVISNENDYASSDFNVRHGFSGALTFAIPTVGKSRPVALITEGWSIDTVIVARTGLPFNAVLQSVSPDPLGIAVSRPDLVPGQPLILYGAQCASVFQGLTVLGPGQTCPGGKGLNPAAFSVPSPIRQGTEGRNDIAGFGLTQVDLSIGRQFPITERIKLQFRADAFNVLNHPNFANPSPNPDTDPTTLLSQQMLNSGLGGLNSLFQEGGPRSLQLSLKLSF